MDALSPIWTSKSGVTAVSTPRPGIYPTSPNEQEKGATVDHTADAVPRRS